MFVDIGVNLKLLVKPLLTATTERLVACSVWAQVTELYLIFCAYFYMNKKVERLLMKLDNVCKIDRRQR